MVKNGVSGTLVGAGELTVGQAVACLRDLHEMRNKDLALVLNVSGQYLTKIIRDERELTFLMSVRLLDWFGLSVEDFVLLLSEQELDRPCLSTIRYLEKEELGRAAGIRLEPISDQAIAQLPGKELTALVMGHLQVKMKR